MFRCSVFRIDAVPVFLVLLIATNIGDVILVRCHELHEFRFPVDILAADKIAWQDVDVDMNTSSCGSIVGIIA